jgi:catechol 2,3-dioxygenase-like lactoylglutathione lyase family enzyme
MVIEALFHVAIKTRDVRATGRFYVEVLGMALEPRPPLDFPGIWLRNPLPGASAIFHIYAGDAAFESDGSFAVGSGVIDHVAMAASGFEGYRERFRRFQLAWRENVVTETRVWQLFVHDPSGVLLELSFQAATEQTSEPQIEPGLQYRPRERFFHAEDYAQFSNGGCSDASRECQ